MEKIIGEEIWKDFLTWAFSQFKESAYNSLGRPKLFKSKDYVRSFVSFSSGNIPKGYSEFSFKEYLKLYKKKGK